MSISTKTANPRKSPVIRVLLLCSLAILTAAPAMAAIGINITDIPKLKEYPLKSQEEFEKTTKVIKQENPYGDSKISYEFRVPKKWSLSIDNPSVFGNPKNL